MEHNQNVKLLCSLYSFVSSSETSSSECKFNLLVIRENIAFVALCLHGKHDYTVLPVPCEYLFYCLFELLAEGMFYKTSYDTLYCAKTNLSYVNIGLTRSTFSIPF